MESDTGNTPSIVALSDSDRVPAKNTFQNLDFWSIFEMYPNNRRGAADIFQYFYQILHIRLPLIRARHRTQKFIRSLRRPQRTGISQLEYSYYKGEYR